MGSWWKDLITAENKLSDLIPELDIPGATVISKTQYDAFYETNLEALLKEWSIAQVVIGGVATHLCCETTARSAFVRGISVFLPLDATATYTREFFRASLLNLSHGFATPVLARELMDQLEASGYVRH